MTHCSVRLEECGKLTGTFAFVINNSAFNKIPEYLLKGPVSRNWKSEAHTVLMMKRNVQFLNYELDSAVPWIPRSFLSIGIAQQKRNCILKYFCSPIRDLNDVILERKKINKSVHDNAIEKKQYNLLKLFRQSL